jgi:hypothetical protein
VYQYDVMDRHIVNAIASIKDTIIVYKQLLHPTSSIYQFVLALASACKDPCLELREEGILVLRPIADVTNSQQNVDTAAGDAEVVPANVPAARRGRKITRNIVERISI